VAIYKRRPVSSVLPTSLHDELLEAAFSEAQAGDFIGDWNPPTTTKKAVQQVFNLKGRYQPLLVAARFRSLKGERRRSFIAALFLAPCQELIIESLGPTHAEPFVEELWVAVDEALEQFPAIMVRLCLLAALAGEGTTSPGVIEYVGVTHPSLQAAGDPEVPEPEFALLDEPEPPKPDAPLRSGQPSHEGPSTSDAALTTTHGGPSGHLDAEHLGAFQAAQQLVARIGDGRRPHEADLNRIALYCERFDDLALEFRALGLPTAPSDATFGELQALLESASARPFSLLAELADIRSDRLIDGLDEVVAEAFRLAALTGTPSGEDEAIAAGLATLLHVLREPAAKAGFLPNAASPSLPPRWLEVAYGVKFGHVVLPAYPELTGADSQDDAASPERSGTSGPEDPEIADVAAAGPSSSEQTESEEYLAGTPSTPMPEPRSPVASSTGDGSPDFEVSTLQVGGDSTPVASTDIAASTQTLGAELLFSGRLAPYYWWATAADEEQRTAVDFSANVALAAVLLDGCRSAFDEFAYKASETLEDSARGLIKSGSVEHAVAHQ
jgi:hypothetical protein